MPNYPTNSTPWTSTTLAMPDGIGGMDTINIATAEKQDEIKQAIQALALGAGGATAVKQDAQIIVQDAANTLLTNLDTKQTTLSSNIGYTVDVTATDDSGAFSLIALTKRSLQQLAELLLRLPTTLGQKAMNASLPVVLSSNQTDVPIALGTPLSSAPALGVGGLGLLGWLSTITARIPLFGVAGTPSGNVTTVQGIAGGQPVPVMGSLSVPPAQAFVLTGTAQSALNTDLLTGLIGTAGWYDVSLYDSAFVNIKGSVGISAGQILLELAHDVNGVGIALPITNKTTGNNSSGALVIPANADNNYELPLGTKFFRIRISTAFVGGTVTATATFSKRAYDNSIKTVTASQSLATALQTTANNSRANIANLNVSSAGIAPAIVVDIASGAIAVTTTSATITPALGLSQFLAYSLTAITGTAPTVQVTIQKSYNNGVTWEDLHIFPTFSAIGTYRSPQLEVPPLMRYVETVTGTTPSITRNVVRNSSSAPLDALKYLGRLLRAKIAGSSVNTTVLSAPPVGLQYYVKSAIWADGAAGGTVRDCWLVTPVGNATPAPADSQLTSYAGTSTAIESYDSRMVNPTPCGYGNSVATYMNNGTSNVWLTLEYYLAP